MKPDQSNQLETEELVVKNTGSLEGQFGVFTKKSFKKNQEIFLIKGPIKNKPSIYSFSVDLNRHIEPLKENGDFDFGHYLNHSCNPNTIIRVIDENNQIPYLKVIARRNIKKSEELNFDYATLEYSTVTNSSCKCNEKNCRGTIHGFKDLPENLVEEYKKENMIPKYLLDIKKD